MADNDFSSIEKLMEFGLSLAVSKQMIQTMNYSVQNMTMPGTVAVKPNMPTKSYFVVVEGNQAGPFTLEEITALIQEHKITTESLMWSQGMSAWTLAKDFPEILKIFLLQPPPID
ncbi:DUF4339 domain-containing protein [Parabacteroides sp. OttesenSCG-928-N08]|nr:DUF4339 domain-containing protein [Parabacteroides sp. OttesenSCG-928-N08]